MWRDLARALSLANLCFLYPTVTLFLTPANRYYMATPPGANDLAALLLNLLALTAGLFTAAQVVRRWENGVTFRLALVVLALLLLFGVSQLWRSIPPPVPLSQLDPTVRRLGKMAALLLLAGIAGAFLFGVARHPRTLLRGGANLLLALSPFVPLILAQATWAAFTPQAATLSIDSAVRTAQIAPPGRVVILLFDELDYGITFARRPAGLQLPELDRFQATALSAIEAYPPAGDTLASIPALLCGRRVEDVEKIGGARLLVDFAGAAEPVSWQEQPTLLSRARSAGARSALVGWYHPYPRILGQHTDRCEWQTYYFWTDRARNSLPQNMWQQFALTELAGRGPAARLNRKHHIASYRRLRESALTAAADPSLSLVFAHLPIPHMPGIFDRRSQRIAPRGPLDMEAYLGNLSLADRTLGEVRSEMTRAGVWNASTVIVTSDHWLRLAGLDPNQSFRVPFLVKLPHQSEAHSYQPRLNTVLMHDLVLEQLRNAIVQPAVLARWLDRRRQQQDQQ